MRIFIAVDISKEAKKEIEKKLYKVLEKKHWSVKWEKPEKLHLTLAFLGNIDNNLLPLIKTICKKAVKNLKPFIVSFKGLGCFPNYDLPGVIWLGLKGDLQHLALIQKRIEASLIKENFKIDTRVFSAHITLGRVRNCRFKERKEIGRQLRGLKIYDLRSKIEINKIIIYESKLSSKGSVYNRLEEIWIK